MAELTVVDLVVIVPSRGRPEGVRRLKDAWESTTHLRSALVVGVDEDDPMLHEYGIREFQPKYPWSYLEIRPRARLGGTLNVLSGEMVRASAAPAVVGFMGDDCIPRTTGWDAAVCGALAEMGSGIVYCNDLLQGEKLPTSVFMTSDIVRTLGWMCPPGLTHLYIDNAWLELGRAMGRIRYLPDVVIEHMHPDAGKAEQDATYRDANSRERDVADRAVFEAWVRDGLPRDVEKLRAAGLC